jgi:hypothetical protein
VTIMQVEQVLGRSWSDLLAEFETFRSRNPTALMERAAVPSRDPDHFAVDDGRVASVWNESDGSLVVRLDGRNRLPEGLVLWGPELPTTFRSRLLPGPGSGSGGRRYGLKISPTRVDLYDFVLDRLVAHLESRLVKPPETELAHLQRITVRVLPQALEEVERPGSVYLRASPASKR